MKIKKLIAIILTTITAACIAVGFSGCDKEIEFPPMTAEKPIYEFESLSSLQIQKRFSKYDKHLEPNVSEEEYENYNAYQEFVNYYNGEFKQYCSEKFYLLNPSYPQEGWGPYTDTRDFEVYAEEVNEDGTFVNALVSETIRLYDRNVGSPYDSNHYHGEPISGVSNWTIFFEIIFCPIMGELSGELSLEFGEYNSNTWRFTNYVNLYIGEICIGTCYYDTGVEIPLSWYQNYFIKNLFYGG